MGRALEFPGRIIVERKEEVLKIAEGWKDRRDTIWTDGSHLDGGKVGAAVAVCVCMQSIDQIITARYTYGRNPVPVRRSPVKPRGALPS